MYRALIAAAAFILTTAAAGGALASGACDTNTIQSGNYRFDISSAELADDGQNLTAIGDVQVDVSGYALTLFGAVLILEERGDRCVVTGGQIDSLGNNFPSLSAMSDITGGATALDIGFSRGDDLAFDAPIAGRETYLYFNLRAGLAMDFGGVTVESSESAAITLVLDPVGPTFYGNVAGIFPSGSTVSLDEVGVGVSATRSLSWSPNVTWNNTAYLTEQRGNVYLNGEASVGINDTADVEFRGDVIADVDFADIAAGRGADRAIDMLAVNGTMFLDLDATVAHVVVELGAASAIYKRGRYVAASARIDPNDLDIPGFGNLIDFDQNARAAFYADGDEFRLDLEGTAEVAGGIEIEADISITERSCTIDAVVDFGADEFSASGSIDSRGRFALSASQSFKVKTGLQKLEGDVTVTVSQNGLSTNSTVKVCQKYWNWKGKKKWACDRVRASVRVDGGKVKVCGAGVCTKLDF